MSAFGPKRTRWSATVAAAFGGLQSQGYHTPVILITAYPNEKNRTRALDAGAVGFLSKPFDEESLIKCLTTAITTPARAVERFITLVPQPRC
jgi:CheY-like chemotaxis protein